MIKRAAQGATGRRRLAAGCLLAVTGAMAVFAQGASAVTPTITKPSVSVAAGTSVVLEALINPQGLPTAYHFEYGLEDCSKASCAAVPFPDGDAGSGSSPALVKQFVEGLVPGTVYHFRVVAMNSSGKAESPVHVFATLNSPSEGLPDGRAYEQVTPVNKDGGDAVGELALVKAASTGNGISFGSAFGIPGGKGAQALPTYVATRGSTAWSTQGLLPPPDFGERAVVLGWLPDFSQSFVAATKLGESRTTALLGQPATGPPMLVAPYVETSKTGYFYAGASDDASTVIFESRADLPHKEGQALEGASNLYAWDKASEELHLASVSNKGTSPPKGAFAGPYNWLAGINGVTLGQGGSARSYYLQDEHAIAANGDTYFTEAGTGQLFMRLNPTQPQSEMKGGECVKAEDACTLHVSASHRSTPDLAGSQPAAFQAASADGSKAFFTSPEKLTDDANTGPEPQPAAIGLGGIGGGIENAKFIPDRAVGVAVDSKYVYWANSVAGSIGRAELDGENFEPNFIPIPPGECETEADPETKPGVFEKVTVPSTPRYLAVDSEHVYWTNTGRRQANGEPLDGGGTIGRADIDGQEASIDPDFICGEDKTELKRKRVSNPQGIAVSASHIYWANAASEGPYRAIARTAIGGGAMESEFHAIPNATLPYGVAVSATHVYFSINANFSNNGSIRRIPLEGGSEEFFGIGKSTLRGIAVDAGHVYWVAQGENAIGRIPIADFPKLGGCEETPNCEKGFTKEIDGDLNGLAADAAHLYWSVNGETPINPGNDLYRYEPDGETLTDLTSLPGGNGAEVQGVLGASADGSRVYFAANGDLDGGGPAEAGDCKTSPAHGSMNSLVGQCNLYLWQEGTGTSLVARIEGRDAVDWAATTLAVFGGFVPKTSFTSADGKTLLFRSREKLTDYDNEGVSELYRFHFGDAGLQCVSCRPGGEAPSGGPSLGSVVFPQLEPFAGAQFASRNLSADGKRAFFETTEALVPADTNGQLECPLSGTSSQHYSACTDVYEWEAPETGQCKESGPAYSALNGGCLYLISTGKSKFPSLFADASETGEDVFFFTRDRLVGQDEDELQDVYDARVDGGLASQHPVFAVPCESVEACHEPAQTPPLEENAATQTFVGPANPASKHKKQKVKKHKKKKHKKARANAKRGAAR
jgi:hypothetical protein